MAKSGLADFREWLATAHGEHSPWGHEDTQPLVTVAESALERQLSATIMRGGAKPAVRKLAKGAVLTEQGEYGDDIYLLLDGVLSVWVDGTQVGELGPGAVVGERAVLERRPPDRHLARCHRLRHRRRRQQPDRPRQPGQPRRRPPPGGRRQLADS